MRILALLVLLLPLLAGCTHPKMVVLPPGGGAGTYAGEFTSETDGSVLGQLSLTISNTGVVSGSGLLNTRSVTITGLLTTGALDGTIVDTLTQFSGRFSGTLFGGTLSGDLRLPRQGDTDLLALWDAALQR